MASYQSLSAQFSPIQQPLDTELMGKVLMAKEQQTNQNIAQIDETLGQLKIQENMLIGDQRKARFANNVQGLLDEVSRSGKLNLQSGDFTRRMKNYVTTALDDYTLEHISKANNIRAFQADVAEKKKKGDGSYNDANYGYAAWKGGLQGYVNEDTDELGNLNYIPYKDLTEEHLKKLKIVKDIKGKRFVEVPDGQGGINRREIDGLTEDEIQSYFGSLMTSEELTQMKINGWAKYGQDETKAREYYTSYNTKNLEKYQQQLEIAKTNSKSSTVSPTKKKEAENQIKILETDIENIQNNITNAGNIAVDDIGLALEKTTYLNGLANMAAAEWSYSVEKDDVWFAQKQLEIDYEDLALKKAKDARDTLEFKAKMQKDYGLNPDGTISTEGQVSVSTSEDTTDKDIDGIGGLEKTHDTYFNEIIDTSKTLYNKLEGDEKETFVANLKKWGIDENFQKMSNFPANASLASNMYQAFVDSGLAKTHKNEYDIMTNAKIKKNAVAGDIVKVQKDSYSKVFNEDPDKYVNGFVRLMDDTKSYGSTERYGIMGYTINEESAINSIKVSSNMEAFIKKAGGKENLKNYLKNNPTELAPFAKLMDEGDKAYKGILPYIKTGLTHSNPVTGVIGLINKRSIFNFTDANLKEDAKETVEKTLVDRSKTKSLTTFSVYDDINILNENTRDKLIQMMPQKRIEGELFKKGQTMTIRRKGEGLEVIQYHGEEVIAGSNGQKRGVTSRIEVDKGDAVFKELAKLVDFEESKRISYNAEDYRSFEASKPQVNNDREKKDSNYEIQNVVSVQTSVMNNPNIADPFLGKDPRVWSTAQQTEKNMQGALTRVVGKDKATNFTQIYMDEINNFRLKAVTAMSPRTGTKTWSLEYYNPSNKRLNIKDLNIQEMDKDTKYLIDNHPEVFISEFILQDIMEDPKFMDAIFKE